MVAAQLAAARTRIVKARRYDELFVTLKATATATVTATAAVERQTPHAERRTRTVTVMHKKIMRCDAIRCEILQYTYSYSTRLVLVRTQVNTSTGATAVGAHGGDGSGASCGLRAAGRQAVTRNVKNAVQQRLRRRQRTFDTRVKSNIYRSDTYRHRRITLDQQYLLILVYVTYK